MGGEPIKNFENHHGYFIVDKKDKSIGFIPLIVFTIYQDREYYLNDLIKKVERED